MRANTIESPIGTSTRLIQPVYRSVIWALLFLGCVVVGSIVTQNWTITALGIGIVLLYPLTVLSIKTPDVVLLLALLVNFAPANHVPGFYLVFFLALVTFLHHAFRGTLRFKVDSVVLLWFGIAILSVLTAPKWTNLHQALQGIKYAWILPLIYYVLISNGYISDKGLRRIILVYFPIVLAYISLEIAYVYLRGPVQSSMSIMSYHTGFDLGWGYSNTLAAVLVFLISIVVLQHKDWSKKPVVRLLMYGVLGITLATLIALMSRGAIVAVAGSIVIYFFIHAPASRRWNIIKSSLYALPLLLAGYFVFKAFIDKLIERFVHLKIDQSTLQRLLLYRNCFLQIKASPIIGSGPQQHIYSDVYTVGSDPHNIFLRYGIETGLISVVLITLIFMIPFFKTLRLTKSGITGMIALPPLLILPYLIALLNAQVEPTIGLYHYNAVFWIYYAIIVKYLSEQGNLRISPASTRLFDPSVIG